MSGTVSGTDHRGQTGAQPAWGWATRKATHTHSYQKSQSTKGSSNTQVCHVLRNEDRSTGLRSYIR
eukprot:3883677-Prymnesium_polylepis.1